jgi:hypothetical protein
MAFRREGDLITNNVDFVPFDENSDVEFHIGNNSSSDNDSIFSNNV